MNALDLDRVAAQLEALEETIIHKLIDRAQFRANLPVYKQGRSGFAGEPDLSLFDLRLRYQEEMDAVFGRFEVPEERPFTPGLPAPRRRVTLPQTGLELKDFEKVNLTRQIRTAYLSLVPRICPNGDDGQYGSSTEHDVYAVQAISRRVHYGALYVAESKYRSDPDLYRALIRAGDAAALESSLTRPEVEERIYSRVAAKVDGIQAQADPRIRITIDPAVVERFYRQTIVPLTRRGEVLYFMARRPAGG